MTERQENILAAIVEHYAKTAQPVGSLAISEHFQISPATIRSEMAFLELEGLIHQPHISAGRVPTDKGYRYYVDNLSQPRHSNQTMSRPSQALHHRVVSAGEMQQALRSAVDSLVEITHNAALATAGAQFYMSGLADLFSQPEFSTGSAYEVAHLLDNIEPWLKEAAPNKRLSVYIGHENPIGKASGCSLIISRFKSPWSDHSYIGVIGPTRQNYQQAMRLVQRASESLEETMNA